jgi:hypothetical protein
VFRKKYRIRDNERIYAARSDDLKAELAKQVIGIKLPLS